MNIGLYFVSLEQNSEWSPPLYLKKNIFLSQNDKSKQMFDQ